MNDAYICDFVRTPIGRYDGALAGLRPDDLAAVVIRALVAKHPTVGAVIDEAFLGCANQAGEDKVPPPDQPGDPRRAPAIAQHRKSRTAHPRLAARSRAPAVDSHRP
jgi:acetyl-CoA acetyltransferase